MESYEKNTQLGVDTWVNTTYFCEEYTPLAIEVAILEVERCLHMSFRDKPLLAHLGLKLRIWDHRMDESS
jgi:hypothetical protein